MARAFAEPHWLREGQSSARLIQEHPCSPIQFSDLVDCDGAKFFNAAADLGLEGIVSKRATSLYRGGRSKKLAEDQEHA
jgi:bifunctional non-homologous end joining protein LigD